MSQAPRPATALVALAAAMLAFTLVGCSTPPWQEGAAPATAGPTSSAPSPSVGPSPSPSASAPPTPARNDLRSGSRHTTLTAGSIRVKVDYWSELDLGSWTAPANKPLSLALTASLPSGTPKAQQVYLSRVSVAVTPTADGTAMAGPDAIVDQATVSPGYAIRTPTSYQQVFTIPALDAAATSVTVQVKYEMLLQTTPTSKTYARQTASDSLTIALA